MVRQRRDQASITAASIHDRPRAWSERAMLSTALPHLAHMLLPGTDEGDTGSTDH